MTRAIIEAAGPGAVLIDMDAYYKDLAHLRVGHAGLELEVAKQGDAHAGEVEVRPAVSVEVPVHRDAPPVAGPGIPVATPGSGSPVDAGAPIRPERSIEMEQAGRTHVIQHHQLGIDVAVQVGPQGAPAAALRVGQQTPAADGVAVFPRGGRPVPQFVVPLSLAPIGPGRYVEFPIPVGVEVAGGGAVVVQGGAGEKGAGVQTVEMEPAAVPVGAHAPAVQAQQQIQPAVPVEIRPGSTEALAGHGQPIAGYGAPQGTGGLRIENLRL